MSHLSYLRIRDYLSELDSPTIELALRGRSCLDEVDIKLFHSANFVKTLATLPFLKTLRVSFTGIIPIVVIDEELQEVQKLKIPPQTLLHVDKLAYTTFTNTKILRLDLVKARQLSLSGCYCYKQDTARRFSTAIHSLANRLQAFHITFEPSSRTKETAFELITLLRDLLGVAFPQLERLSVQTYSIPVDELVHLLRSRSTFMPSLKVLVLETTDERIPPADVVSMLDPEVFPSLDVVQLKFGLPPSHGLEQVQDPAPEQPVHVLRLLWEKSHVQERINVWKGAV